LPVTASSLLASAYPLILDGSAGVRSQSLQLLQVFPKTEILENVGKSLPYVRAGMTHLSKEIRSTAIEILSFLVKTAGAELVSCPGGWHQTLECFMTVLGWRTAANKATLPSDVKSTARIMQVLDDFLRVGLVPARHSYQGASIATEFPLWQVRAMLLPTKSNAYAHLNLFGSQTDNHNQILDGHEDRLQDFAQHFQPDFTAGMALARKEGGELGRAAGLLIKTVEWAQKT
jgi:pre-rRNA-processing protein IPI1